MSKTAHQLLTNLEESGDLKVLVKGGFCQPSIFRDLNIYRSVNAQVQTGSKRGDAIMCTAVNFKLTMRHVQKILSNFK